MEENKIGISGADYIIPPKADHPFWDDEEIAENLTATATVDNSTGTPSVDVTKNGYNLDFAFKNLKGEKGDTGARGTSGADGKNGTSVIVSKIDTPESGAVVGRITGLKSQELDPTVSSNYETIEVRNGEKGEKGDKGDPGPQGEPGLQGTPGKDGVSPIVTSTGSTESGASAGTITDAAGNKITVYNGAKGATGTTGATPDITATATVDNTTGTPAVTVTKSGAAGAPTLAFAFSGIKGEKGDTGAAGKDGSDADVSKCVTNVFVTNNSGTYTIRQTKGNGTTTYAGDITVSGVDLFTTQFMYPQPQLSDKHNFPSTAPADGRYFLMRLTFRVDNPTAPNTYFDDLAHIIVAKADSSYAKGFEIVIGDKIDFLIGTQSKTIIENTDISIDENPFTGNANGTMLVHYISDDGTEREIRNMGLWYEGVIS